jgi:hypothetical protein
MTGTQQYRRMESNSTNAPSANGSMGVKAARKTGERETNAPNSFKAPQAAEERETNAPCQRERAEDTETRETNMSEKDTAAARRDGKPPAIAEQQRRQGVAAVDEPPNQAQKGATIMDTPQATGLDPGENRRMPAQHTRRLPSRNTGEPGQQGPFSQPQQMLAAPADSAAEGGIRIFNPDEVRRIIQAARAGPEGSLTAICMLDDDIALFMHAFPDADDRELRAHCLSTLLEYEESMQAWEEAKNSGELDSDGSDSEDEDELTGIELLRDLDLSAPRAPASAVPVARPNHIEWPKRVLRQTILVSGIAAEIESNIDQADWDADCYKGCRR